MNEIIPRGGAVLGAKLKNECFEKQWVARINVRIERFSMK